MFASTLAAEKKVTRPACRAGATPGNFLGGESRKSGCAPAHFWVFSAATLYFSIACIPRSSNDLPVFKGCRTRQSRAYGEKVLHSAPDSLGSRSSTWIWPSW